MGTDLLQGSEGCGWRSLTNTLPPPQSPAPNPHHQAHQQGQDGGREIEKCIPGGSTHCVLITRTSSSPVANSAIHPPPAPQPQSPTQEASHRPRRPSPSATLSAEGTVTPTPTRPRSLWLWPPDLLHLHGGNPTCRFPPVQWVMCLPGHLQGLPAPGGWGSLLRLLRECPKSRPAALGGAAESPWGDRIASWKGPLE